MSNGAGVSLLFPERQTEAQAKSCTIQELSFYEPQFPYLEGIWYSVRIWHMIVPVFEGHSRHPGEEGRKGRGEQGKPDSASDVVQTRYM